MLSRALTLKDKRLARYILVGLTAFLIEYLLFYILYRGGLQILIANTISFMAGLVISFTFNRGWAFNQGAYEKSKNQQMVLYATLAAFNLLASNIIVGGLKYLGMDPKIAKIVAIAAIAAWNFITFRLIIFREKTRN